MASLDCYCVFAIEMLRAIVVFSKVFPRGDSVCELQHLRLRGTSAGWVV